eukprot:441088-Lingulodinium_polyedra.AAC.1
MELSQNGQGKHGGVLCSVLLAPTEGLLLTWKWCGCSTCEPTLGRGSHVAHLVAAQYMSSTHSGGNTATNKTNTSQPKQQT